MRPPSYYRARLAAIAAELQRETDDRRVKLLQNGYLPDFQPSSKSRPSPEDNRPLTFLELCSWDTWVAMHPEKVCGETVITTSRAFPLAVKASRNDVVRTVTEGIRIAETEREILKLELELLHVKI